MTLIDRNGLPSHDAWLYQEREMPLVASERSVVALSQWEAFEQQFGVPAKGLWVDADQPPEALQGLLAELELLVIGFPKSRDGRGFTLARLLRERYAFVGDLRAAGPMLPDQFAMLLQCGFTSLLAPPTVPVVRWQQAADARLQAQARLRTLLERLSHRHEA